MHSDTLFSVTTIDPDSTRQVGRICGTCCTGGEVILLSGDLGAGKTCFVQGLAQGIDVPPEIPVTSPTFTLHACYDGRVPLNHLDLYRFEGQEIPEEIGIDELLCDCSAVTVVEWAEFLGCRLPGDHLAVRFTIDGSHLRRIRFMAIGTEHIELLARLRESLQTARETMIETTA